MSRGAFIRGGALLAGLDSLSKHPLGSADVFRLCLWNRVPPGLHGHAELSQRRVLDIFRKRAICGQLYTQLFWCCTAVGGETDVRPLRGQLVM